MKIILGMPGGSKLWINPAQIVKMEKNSDGRYFLYLTNGEIFEIDHRTASTVEECLEID